MVVLSRMARVDSVVGVVLVDMLFESVLAVAVCPLEVEAVRRSASGVAVVEVTSGFDVVLAALIKVEGGLPVRVVDIVKLVGSLIGGSALEQCCSSNCPSGEWCS